MRANEYRKYELLSWVNVMQRESCMGANECRKNERNDKVLLLRHCGVLMSSMAHACCLALHMRALLRRCGALMSSVASACSGAKLRRS